MKIEFVVPSVPVAQPRQRHRIAGKGKKQFVQNYTPTKHPVNFFKASVQQAAAAVYSGPPLDGPLFASYVFVMPRAGKPSWITRKDFPFWFGCWKAGERVPHVSKEDRDNLTKSLQDAMNKTVFTDDSRVFSGPIEKWVASEFEQPHVEVTIETIDEIEPGEPHAND